MYGESDIYKLNPALGFVIYSTCKLLYVILYIALFFCFRLSLFITYFMNFLNKNAPDRKVKIKKMPPASSSQLQKKAGSAPTAAIITLGCKVNQYESEAIAERLTSLGFDVLTSADVCDVYI